MDGQAPNALDEGAATIVAVTRLKRQRSALAQVSLSPEA